MDLRRLVPLLMVLLTDRNFTLTTFSPTGATITSSGTKKGEFHAADVNTQLKNKNITTDIKVDACSNFFTTITADEPAPGLKTIFSFKVPDQRSGNVEVHYLHDYAAVSSSIGLTVNPTVNFSVVIGTNVASLGTDLSFDTKTGDFIKCNAGVSLSKVDLIASLTLITYFKPFLDALLGVGSSMRLPVTRNWPSFAFSLLFWFNLCGFV